MKIDAPCIAAGSLLVAAIGFSVAVILSLLLAALHLIPSGVSISLAKELGLAILGAGALLARRILRH